jgi:hypothetical protein
MHGKRDDMGLLGSVLRRIEEAVYEIVDKTVHSRSVGDRDVDR